MKKIIILLLFFFLLISNSFCAEIDGAPDSFSGAPHAFGLASNWLPSLTEDNSIHLILGNWLLMFDGALFASYDWQDILQAGLRSSRQFTFPNWFVIAGEHPVFEKSRFLFKTKFSFEPFTQSNNGTPLLFETGGALSDTTFFDRQHPNDIISELSLSYEQFLAQNWNLFAYIAFPGDPALGPPSYMERPSAKNNPESPLGHNWQDATHLTYGVATLGLQYSFFKIEGSIFNGNSPDQDRLNIDTPTLDSWSARFSFNPLPSTAAQVSYGFIKSPNILDLTIDIQRITFSILNISELDNKNNIATSFVWGMNTPSNGEPENSFLLESDMEVNKNHSVYCRFEFVQKNISDLGIIASPSKITYVNALTLGTAKKLANMTNTNIVLSLGAQATINFVNDDLKSVYGSYPLSVQVFLKLTPGKFEGNN